MDLRIFTEPQQGATYDQLLAAARVTEECGFDGFFRSDHYLRIGPGDPGPGPTDAWITLAGLARETNRVRLGTLVSPVGFRHPGALAIAVAQVDAMSGGRVELGLGAGWYEDEFRAYGLPFSSFAQRFSELEEQLSVVTGLWETPPGETFSYTGEHYRLVGSPALPKPVQRPRPPVIVGGSGLRKTPRLAARFADELNAGFTSAAEVGKRFDAARGACEEAGRDPATLLLSTTLTLCCGADETEVARRAQAIGRPVESITAAGTPAQVVETLRAYETVGARRAYLQLMDLDDLDHIRLVAEEVMPHVTG